MTRTSLGAAALSNACFVGRLARGSAVRMATADKVLTFVGAEPIGPRFRQEIETYLETTGTKAHVFGEEAARDPSFVLRLRRGASPMLDTVDRVRAWMRAHGNPTPREAVRAAVGDGSSSGSTDSADGREEQMQPQTYLSTREAAAFLGLSPRTLDRYRVSGDGPAFHRFGNRVLYHRADLTAWAAERRVRSTSDEGRTARRAA